MAKRYWVTGARGSTAASAITSSRSREGGGVSARAVEDTPPRARAKRKSGVRNGVGRMGTSRGKGLARRRRNDRAGRPLLEFWLAVRSLVTKWRGASLDRSQSVDRRAAVDGLDVRGRRDCNVRGHAAPVSRRGMD